MPRPSSSDPQVRYALREANMAFSDRRRRQRADPIVFFLAVVSAVMSLTYIVRA